MEDEHETEVEEFWIFWMEKPPRVFAPDPTCIQSQSRRVAIIVPSEDYVIEHIQRTIDHVRLDGREPRIVLVGIRWWLALKSYRVPWSKLGFAKGDEPVIHPDATMERGCRVLCEPVNELHKFATLHPDLTK